MPELPEVETIKRDLESELVGLKFTDVKFLWNGSLKGTAPNIFKKKVIGQKITGVQRRAKNLIIRMSGGQSLLLHMKMTGHLLVESAALRFDQKGNWLDKSGALSDPFNQYIRVVFWLDNGNILAFSDLRKFGYIKLVSNLELDNILSLYGPEPFSTDFNIGFMKKLFGKKKQAIKKVLMDQKNIAGIGNIYADEILWAAQIHPEVPANSLNEDQIQKIYKYTLEILNKAVKLHGTSTSDYRDTKGNKGLYEKELNVYRRKEKPCPRCGQMIERISLGGRGTHFCSHCQKGESK